MRGRLPFYTFLFEDHKVFLFPACSCNIFLSVPVFSVSLLINYPANSLYLLSTKPFFLGCGGWAISDILVPVREVARFPCILSRISNTDLIEFREFISSNFQKFVQSFIVLNSATIKRILILMLLAAGENIKCPISQKFKMFTDMWIYYGLEKIVAGSLNILWLQWRARHAIRQEFLQKFVHAQLVKTWLFGNLFLSVTFLTFSTFSQILTHRWSAHLINANKNTASDAINVWMTFEKLIDFKKLKKISDSWPEIPTSV